MNNIDINNIIYNPLDIDSIGESIVRTIIEKPCNNLSDLKPFMGIGTYIIYYIGEFEVYKNIRAKNINNKFDQPIYVGKAVSAGSRKGGKVSKPKYELYNRLKEHADSIKIVENLDINDFYYRYLLVDNIWISLGESMLITKYKPLWNVVIDGFGNHAPGKGRSGSIKSLWDTLHPGRKWSINLKNHNKTIEQIKEDIEKYRKENDNAV